MLIEGAIILVIGMAAVFLFLGLLVGLMKVVAFFMYDEEAIAAEIEQAKKQKGGFNEEIAVAIAVAMAVAKGN